MTLPHLIPFDQIGDPALGYISIAEAQKNIPFAIKRVYWTYFTPNHVERGNHAHIKLNQVLFAVAGILQIRLEDRNGNSVEFTLDQPNVGLFVPEGYWRTIRFSHSAVLLCLASEYYDESDYIREYSRFKTEKEA